MKKLAFVVAAITVAGITSPARSHDSTEHDKGYVPVEAIDLYEQLGLKNPDNSAAKLEPRLQVQPELKSGAGAQNGAMSQQSAGSAVANGGGSDLSKPSEKIEETKLRSTVATEGTDAEKAVQESEAGKKQGRLYSEENWIDSFEVGYSLMPEYNDQGENEGFEEANIFARFNFDSRFRETPDSAWHAGVTAAFFSSHVGSCPDQNEAQDDDGSDEDQNEEVATMAMDDGDGNGGGDGTNNTDEQKDDEEECDDSVNLSDVKFTDVADTLKATIYLWRHMRIGPDKPLGTTDYSSPYWFELGFGGRASIQSREKLDDNGDSINSIYAAGARVVLHDFRTVENKNGNPNRNGLPRLLVEALVAEYEDFAGIEDTTRYLFNARWRVKKAEPWYLGLHVNSGKGPDELALTLNYGIQLAEFFDFAGKAP